MNNWRISRRRFLGSAAAVIGLPYLASVVERHAEASEDCAAPQRFIAFFVPNGIHMPDFTPSAKGKDWAMPYILAPLEPIRNKIAVVTGIDYQRTAEPAEPPGGHGSGTGSFLTMMPVNKNDKNPARISLDQKIAKTTAACARPLPSLQLGLKVRGDGSDRVPNIAFIETISWDANKPLPFLDDPQQNFDRIFAGADPDASAADAARRQAVRTSVLDHVLGEAETLKTELSPTDRVKLDQYMTSVRELETRIQNLGNGATCAKPDRPTATSTAPYQDRVAITLDLAALAFECDVTRVITFMFGRGNSMQDFSFLFNGESTPHHHTSHHAGDAKLQAKLKEIGRWEINHVAKFLKRLDQTVEVGGRTLLDNTLAYFNSEISDGNVHRKYDMPVLLAGSAGGKLKVDGSHYMFTQMTFPRPLLGPSGGPHGIRLFVSILNAFGIPDQTFGDESAKGPLTELLV
ncbi:DUF1552 domain-containing protein [Sorangium sp. So ce394]|uniref:DUF1552 domain-containing protein n=1 Tax=Sorangium sp. So ce394 TaxID=3133310 RepID=UPI003F5BEDF3